MKVIAKYLLLMLAIAFLGNTAIIALGWPDGLFGVVPAFFLLLGMFVTYLLFKASQSKVLSTAETDEQIRFQIALIKVGFSLVSCWLLVTYGYLTRIAYGLRSFGGNQSLSIPVLFVNAIPVILILCFVVSVWWRKHLFVLGLRLIGILILGSYLMLMISWRSATEIAVYLIIYLTTWAFLTSDDPKKFIQPVAGGDATRWRE